MKKEATLDILGRVCIPKKMRDSLNFVEGDKLTIELTDDKLIVSKGSLDMVCPVCNSKFNSDYKFCPHCGQYLVNNEDEQSSEE